MTTRRQALVAAVAAPLVARAAPAAAAVGGDAAVLTHVARVELVLQAAYRYASRTGSGRVEALAGAFAGHEADHLGALATGLEALGAPRPVAPRNLGELDGAVATLGVTPAPSRTHGPRALLRLLLALEQASLLALNRAHGELADQHLLQTATTIMGCQAQHAVVLRQALHREPLPGALEPAAG